MNKDNKLLNSIGFKSLAHDIISRLNGPSTEINTQPLKSTNEMNHPDNKYFLESLSVLCERMKGNPAQKHYDKFYSFSVQDICDKGAIYNHDTYEHHCGPLIGIPQYGLCNKRVWVEIMRGSEAEWVDLQHKWNTPIDYINKMKQSLATRGNLSGWFEYYPKIFGNKYQKLFHNNNNQNINENNNTQILQSSNKQNNNKSGKKRKHSQIKNNANILPPPPPPYKRAKIHNNQNTINIFNKNNKVNNEKYIVMDGNNITKYGRKLDNTFVFNARSTNTNNYNTIHRSNNLSFTKNESNQNYQIFGDSGKVFDTFENSDNNAMNKYDNNLLFNNNNNFKSSGMNTIENTNNNNNAMYKYDTDCNDNNFEFSELNKKLNIEPKKSKQLRKKKHKKKMKKKDKKKKGKKTEANPDKMDTWRNELKLLNNGKIKIHNMGVRTGRMTILVYLNKLDPQKQLKRTKINVCKLINSIMKLPSTSKMLLTPSHNYGQINQTFKPTQKAIDILQNIIKDDKLYLKISKKIKKKLKICIEEQIVDSSGDDDSDLSSHSDSSSNSCSDNNGNDNNNSIQNEIENGENKEMKNEDSDSGVLNENTNENNIVIVEKNKNENNKEMNEMDWTNFQIRAMKLSPHKKAQMWKLLNS